MGLITIEASAVSTPNHLFDVVRNPEAAPHWGIYRCQGCGQPIPYDSLSAQCLCTEECYLDSGARDTL